jgi:hypothetical protein
MGPPPVSDLQKEDIEKKLNIKLDGINDYINSHDIEDQIELKERLNDASYALSYLKAKTEDFKEEMRADQAWLDSCPEHPTKIRAYAAWRFEQESEYTQWITYKKPAGEVREELKEELKEYLQERKKEKRVFTKQRRDELVAHRKMMARRTKRRMKGAKDVGNGWLHIPTSDDHRSYYLHKETKSITGQKPHVARKVDGRWVPPAGILEHTPLTDPKLSPAQRAANKAARKAEIEEKKRNGRKLTDQDKEDWIAVHADTPQMPEREEDEDEEEDEEDEEDEEEYEEEPPACAAPTPSPWDHPPKKRIISWEDQLLE